MPISNSKLTPKEKSALKALRAALADVAVAHFPAWGLTLAYRSSGSCMEFSTACCSPSEKKYRKKVGAWFALDRFDAHETSKMPFDTFFEFLDMLGVQE